MSRRIVVAIGGNAILSNDASVAAQYDAIKMITRHLAVLLEEGNELIIVHGNGPQVGNLLLQQRAAESEKNPVMPLDTLVAMTQGSIGHWIQNALQQELKQRGINKDVVTLVTKVLVDADDPAFQNPTKPIGPFLTEAQARAEMKEKPQEIFKSDAGRGWRRNVPSPRPVSIKEGAVARKLLDEGVIPIAAGGGGIPVVEKDGQLVGIEAVIDKDLAAELLAKSVAADMLIILTGVDNVYIHYNTPEQETLNEVSVAELEKYCEQGLFEAGSMLPKIQAAMDFVRSGDERVAVITSIEQLSRISEGVGTVIRGTVGLENVS